MNLNKTYPYILIVGSIIGLLASFILTVDTIKFIQDPNVTVLDLSNKYYSLSSRCIDVSTIYGNLKRSSPNYYPESTPMTVG